MSTANEKLAAALDELRLLQEDGSRVFASEQLTRRSRERLVKHGFLQEVMKGWLMSASPSALPGDTTPWFAAFWEFCRRYGEARFGATWHLSPEQSLLIHAANTTIPKQVVISSPRANNNRTDLLFATSLFALKENELPPAHDLEIKDGLRLYRAAAALTRVTEDFFVRYPIETQVIVSSIQEPSLLLRRLLEGGHSTIAGRLAGLFRRLGRPAIADELIATMTAADHVVREVDPLEPGRIVYVPRPATPPVVGRLQALWAATREVVLAELPSARRKVADRDAHLLAIQDAYKLDAYHSLSIEGYHVTPDLIARVATGAWAPEKLASDRDSKDALAARGYWLAFERVRSDVRRVLTSNNAPQVVRSAHRDWYREMFSPHVAAGLIDGKMLAGYRNGPVFIRGSQHVPPRWEVVPEAMAALFDLIEAEAEATVRAVLGHWLVGYVHPFPDGNGRIARFVMNTLLAAGGYPWTIIQVDDRDEYLATLETASVASDVRPFARFVAKQMQRTAALVAASARSRTARRPRR